MKHDLHYSQSVKAGSHVVHHNADSLGEALELTHRRRLDDIEGSKKYKAQQQRLPCDRSRNQSDKLAGDFVDDHNLRILAIAGSGHAGGSGNSHHNSRES